MATATWCGSRAGNPPEVGMYGRLDGATSSLRGLKVPEEVQGFMEQGLAQEWNFNQHEALRNFRHAVTLAPHCALCWWALARAHGPNINRGVANQTALNIAAAKALEVLEAAEQAHPKGKGAPELKLAILVRAMQRLIVEKGVLDWRGLYEKQAAARRLYAAQLCTARLEAHATEASDELGDADLDLLCADAMMTTTPWDYYRCGDVTSTEPCRVVEGAGQLKPQMLLAAGLLEKLSARGGEVHPLTLHLLIHLTEPSGAPWRDTLKGKESADALLGLLPGAGHLQHMPAHLYMRLGLWTEGVQSSLGAASANHAYMAKCLQPYSHGHNLRMGGWHARMAGDEANALRFAREHQQGAAALASFGAQQASIDGCSNISSEEPLALARFGEWARILDLGAVPPRCTGCVGAEARLDSMHRAYRAYALGLAQEGSGVSSAETLELLETLAKELLGIPTLYHLGVGAAPALPLLLLRARRRWAQGHFAAAAESLQNASRRLENALYREPPVWYYDPRDCLGYVRLHGLGDAVGALAAHQETQRKWNGRSPWALLGEAQALTALGRTEEAATAMSLHRQQWKGRAPLDSPCPQFSRLDASLGRAPQRPQQRAGPQRAGTQREGTPLGLMHMEAARLGDAGVRVHSSGSSRDSDGADFVTLAGGSTGAEPHTEGPRLARAPGRASGRAEPRAEPRAKPLGQEELREGAEAPLEEVEDGANRVGVFSAGFVAGLGAAAITLGAAWTSSRWRPKLCGRLRAAVRRKPNCQQLQLQD